MDRQVDAGDWREVDRQLRTIARKRAALDANEAAWLREAERLKIWRPLGMVSAIDYMERVLGYAPRAAQERLRVARALGDLPELAAALGCGELGFSAVRELTRVATPGTEAAWRRAAAGKNLRELEELVAGRRPGSLPDEPADPDLRTRVVRFELDPATFARLRQARLVLDEEHGAHLDDNQLVAALCDAVLDGATAEGTGRAKFQIALTVCARCDQGWQDGAGAKIAVDAATVERARCDAQHLGSVDEGVPARAWQDIPPSVSRLVWRRDHGRCQTPGCRSARGLEIHHIVRRADGGDHEASNLTLRCGACHHAIHNGTLVITGTAPAQLDVRRPHADVSTEPTDLTDLTELELTGLAGPTDATEPAELEPTGLAGPTDATAPTGPEEPVGPTEPKHAESLSAAPIANSGDNRSAYPIARPSTKLDAATIRAQARDALVGLGWKAVIARAAVEAACAHVGAAASLEPVIREALRRCPRPAS